MSTTIDQDRIDRYADVTGDRNPLHVDPGFAAGTPYGTTIAHGLLVAALVVGEVVPPDHQAWPLELDIVFVRPVPAGSTVTVVRTEREDLLEASATTDGAAAVVVRVRAGSEPASGTATAGRPEEQR